MNIFLNIVLIVGLVVILYNTYKLQKEKQVLKAELNLYDSHIKELSINNMVYNNVVDGLFATTSKTVVNKINKYLKDNRIDLGEYELICSIEKDDGGNCRVYTRRYGVEED